MLEITDIMDRNARRLTLLSLGIWSNLALAQINTLVVRADSFPDSISLTGHLEWCVDSSNTWNIDAVTTKSFRPFDQHLDTIYLSGKCTYWFRFSIQDTAPTDSLVAMLHFNRCGRVHLFTQNKNDEWVRKSGGVWTGHQGKDLVNSRRFFLPLIARPKQTQPFYIKLFDYGQQKKVRPDFILFSIKKARERMLQELTDNLGLGRFQGGFYGILLFISVFSLFHFWPRRDKAWLFYACYLLCIALFYLRGAAIDGEPSFWVAYILEWSPNIEVPNAYLIYVSYLLFVYYFLNLQTKGLAIKQMYKIFIPLFLGLIVLNILIQVVWGFPAGLQFHNFTRLFLFGFGFWLVYVVFFRLKDPLAKFIIIGSLFLLVGAIITLFSDMTSGTNRSVAWGALREYTTEGGTQFWWYDMRTGILLEILCFSIGLGYRNNQIADERDRVQRAYIAQLEETTQANEEKYQAEYDKSQAELEKAWAEMKALKAQMNSHFIFNTLNGISDLVRQGKTSHAIDNIAKFAGLLRRILTLSEKPLIPLEEELELTLIYLELEKMRRGDKFVFEIEVDENVPVDYLQIPPLSFQVYLENAIEHGLLQKDDPDRRLSLWIKDLPEETLCIIDDNGIGRPAAMKNAAQNSGKPPSFGMRITQERLAQYNMRVDIVDKKDAQNKPSGTRVEIRLPKD